MLDLLRAPAPTQDAAFPDALARAAGTFARLDQALGNHPLRPAFLHRARLEAVRHQAAIDGKAIAGSAKEQRILLNTLRSSATSCSFPSSASGSPMPGRQSAATSS
jgi:hypothetical protein